jgi:hypothetical protein
MSYRSKAEGYRGGRVNPEEDKPAQLAYPCFATNCPMAGVLYPDQMLGEKHNGVCAWHYGVVSSDIPRVTSALRSWECVTYEIEAGRRVLTGDLATDAAAQDAAFVKAWERLKPLAGTWEEQLEPAGRNYGTWLKHLERFIGARVVEVLSANQQRRAA